VKGRSRGDKGEITNRRIEKELRGERGSENSSKPRWKLDEEWRRSTKEYKRKTVAEDAGNKPTTVAI
jgi:hypothetical protein